MQANGASRSNILKECSSRLPQPLVAPISDICCIKTQADHTPSSWRSEKHTYFILRIRKIEPRLLSWPSKVPRPLARCSSKIPKKKTTKAKAATILAGAGMRPNPVRQLIQFVRRYRNPLREAFFEKRQQRE